MKTISLSRNRHSGIVFEWMKPRKEQVHITESGVSVPPALIITDETGAVWTLGYNPGRDGPKGEFSYNVLRNGENTGAFASRIEMRGNKIRCFTRQGWRNWNGRSFV